MNLLEVKDLSLVIDGKTIFKEVNFKILKGEIHALIGVNGCGKSSIASVLMGLVSPTKGSIFLAGEDITNLSITDRAKRGLTLAWQEPTRFEGISVKQYLELSGKTKDMIQIRNALNTVGLLPSLYLSRKVDKSLSGGERKRIELASVYLLKPKIAILDEIDSGVDYVAIEKVLETIKTISSKGSVLLITHQDEFLKIADVATLICNGIVLRTGNPNEISKYYKYECAFCDDEERRKNPLEEFLNVTG